MSKSIQNYFKIIFFALTSLAFTVVTVALLQHILPDSLSNMLLGYREESYPITFQTVMWYPFCLGLMIAFRRYYTYNENQKDLDNPSYNIVNLLADSMSEIDITRQAFRHLAEDRMYLYPRVFASGLEAMMESSRYSDVKEEIEVSVGYIYTELDANYNRIRYISWLLPTLGFMGTVYGISQAVEIFGSINAEDPTFLPKIASALALAFNTTLLALFQAAIIVLIFTHFEGLENKLVARIGLNAQNKCRRILRHLAKSRATNQRNAS